MATRWRTAWITGASSGIGRALALALVERGVKVVASARSADKLAELAAGHPGISPLPLDVTDLAAMRQATRSIAATLGSLDLVVLNAGVFAAMSARNFSASTAARSMDVNYQGVVHGIDAALPLMLARGEGHIALIGSVAGYRGLPPAAAYGPSKAALINLAEALYNDLAQRGVAISVVNPGYVATPMNQNVSALPFRIGAEDAALRILRGLEKRKFEIAFPWPLVAMMKLARHMPYPLFFACARRVLAPPRTR